MKNFFKAAKAGLMIMVCALFLGIGIKAEAANQITGLKQTNHSYTAVQVEWNALSGVDLVGYKVEWCENASFTGATYSYGYIQDTECPISKFLSGKSLSSGKSYWVKVTAVTVEGGNAQDIAGTTSSPLEVVTAPMSKVSNLKQTKAAAKGLTLTWKPASGGANAYLVDYYKAGTDPNKSKQKTATTTSCNLSGLTVNTKYDVAVYAARKSSAGYVASVYDVKYEYCVAKYMSTTLNKKVTKVKFIKSGSDANPSATVAYFTWAKNDAAQGYEYTVYGNNGKKLFKGTTTTNTPNDSKNPVLISNKKLKNNQFMKIKVKAYIIVNGKKKYGPESDVCWFAKYPPNVKESMVGRYASDGVKISWKKMTGAKNYTVYVSTSPNSGYKKVATTSGTSCVIKKCNGAALTTYRDYYYKIVASKKVKKKTIKSCNHCHGSFYIKVTYY